MAQHVIETVTFRLKDGVPRERFVEAAMRANAFITARPGFIRRRLSLSADGLWSEHIEWADMENAKAAAKAIGGSADAASFLQAIDGSTVSLSHSALEIAVN